MKKFTFTGTRMCGIKDGIRNEWCDSIEDSVILLGLFVSYLLISYLLSTISPRYSVFEAIKNLAEWNTLPYTGVIDRPDLQEILLGNMDEGRVQNSRPVCS